MKPISSYNFCAICGKKTTWQVMATDDPNIIWIDISCSDELCQNGTVLKCQVIQEGFDEDQ